MDEVFKALADPTRRERNPWIARPSDQAGPEDLARPDPPPPLRPNGAKRSRCL